jgi:hypothetical protein
MDPKSVSQPNLDRQESRIQRIVKKPSLVKYIIQSMFGVIVLLLCSIKVIIHPDQSNEVWIGLICAIVGIFLPHPTPAEGTHKSQHDGDDTTTTTIHERITSTPMIRPVRLSAELKSRDPQ